MKTLFEANELGSFVRVEHTPEFVAAFDVIYKLQTDILYNHSPIYPFSYLNKGRLKLFLNEDFGPENGYIPVVKKNEETASYFIHAPSAEVSKILETVKKLDKLSKQPVKICDVTEGYAYWFLEQTTGWEKRKTSDDVIQDAEALATLKGRRFSSLRNTLKHVREDLRPLNAPIRPYNYKDSIRVFEDWKEKQGKKYFRVTIGRDIRLIEEYYDKLDFENFFGYIHYVGPDENGQDKPVATSFGCRSAKDPEFGIDVTVKADIEYKGMADFAFVYLMTEMNRAGIKYVNDSGYYSPSIKLNKLKFAPIKTIPMFDLARK